MSKKIKIVSLFILLFCVCGCGKNIEQRKEINLCDNLYVLIEKFENQKITFNTFVEEVDGISNIFCSENPDNLICNQIKLIKNQSKQSYTLENCDASPDSLKDLCEETNIAVKSMMEQREQVEKAYVYELKYQCQRSKIKTIN